MDKLRGWILKYSILIHTCIAGTFIGSYALGYQTGPVLDFYNTNFLRQAWQMFSPDPTTHEAYIFYKCNKADTFEEFPGFLTFFDRLGPSGTLKHMQRNLAEVIAVKQKRVKQGTHKPQDLIILKEATSLLTVELEKFCESNDELKNAEEVELDIRVKSHAP